MKQVYILNEFTGDGFKRQSVFETQEAAKAFIPNLIDLFILDLGGVLEFYQPGEEPDLWSQSYETDDLGRLVYSIVPKELKD